MNPRKLPQRNRKGSAALLLLVLGASVFTYSMLKQFVPGATAGPRANDDLPPPADPGGPESDAAAPAADLLARYGSYKIGTVVPFVFGRPRGVGIGLPAPAGETMPAAAWTGPDPRPLKVTFLMVGGSVARAVVDGQVVGVGDPVAGGSVLTIQRDGVQVRDGKRTLFYDLDSDWPREFRTEHARRTAEAQPRPGEAAASDGAVQQTKTSKDVEKG